MDVIPSTAAFPSPSTLDQYQEWRRELLTATAVSEDVSVTLDGLRRLANREGDRPLATRINHLIIYAMFLNRLEHYVTEGTEDPGTGRLRGLIHDLQREIEGANLGEEDDLRDALFEQIDVVTTVLNRVDTFTAQRVRPGTIRWNVVGALDSLYGQYQQLLTISQGISSLALQQLFSHRILGPLSNDIETLTQNVYHRVQALLGRIDPRTPPRAITMTIHSRFRHLALSNHFTREEEVEYLAIEEAPDTFGKRFCIMHLTGIAFKTEQDNRFPT